MRSLLVMAGVSVALAVPSASRAAEVTPPVVVEHRAVVWSASHAQAEPPADVPVVLTIDAEGSVTDVTVVGDFAPDVVRAARDGARAFRFRPATRDGIAVASKVRERVVFQIDAPPSPAVPEGPPGPAAGPPEEARVLGRTAPRSASELTRGREVLEAAPRRTSADLLNIVPGVFVTQHGGEGKAHQIFMRGFDAVHGQDVELWVGGVPVNDVSNVHGQGYADLHFVSPEVVHEVSAQGGPFDPRQGDFAVAGTVRMRLGLAEEGAVVKGTLGSFGTRRLFVGYRPRGEDPKTFASFEEYATDGFGPNRAARRGSFLAQVAHDFAGGISARVLFGTYSGRYDSAGVLPRRDIEQGRLDRYATLDPRQGGRGSRTQVLAELKKEGDRATFALAPFVVARGMSLRQNFTGYLTGALRGEPNVSDNSEQKNDALTLGATGSMRYALPLLSKRDTTEVGLYGRHDRVSQSQTRLRDVDDRVVATLVDADLQATHVAAYVDEELRLGSRVTVRGGARVDSLSYAVDDRSRAPGPSRSAQGTHVGEKVSVDVFLGRGVRLVGSYGRGFRSPQARSLANGETAPFTDVTSFEVGLRGTLGRALAGSVAAYTSGLDGDLVFDPETARNEPVPGTRRTGVTAELLAHAGEGLVLSGSATYTRAAFVANGAGFVAGDLLPYVPQIVVRTDARYTHALAKVFARELEGRVGLGLDGVLRRPLPYGEIGQNVVLFDASLGLRLREVELSLDATNLLGQPYYDGQFVFASSFSGGATPSRIPVQHVTQGPPRAFYASVTLHF